MMNELVEKVTGNLPAAGKKIFEEVYEKAKSGTCRKREDKEECAAKIAWTAVKNAGWHKDKDGNWSKKAMIQEFSMTIKSVAYDKPSNEMRWKADASDTDEDSQGDNMSIGLYNRFMEHINSNEPAPESFRSEFWSGGMPYLSISHYPDLNGEGVPGPVDAVYVDGKFLKARGRFDDNPLGRACFKAICSELYAEDKSEHDDDNKVRISIGFLDWRHRHKSNDFIFERRTLDDMCPQCLLELIRGEYGGREFLDGQLIHLALTRVPVNVRTIMEVDKSMTTQKEDAASIIGDELAEELEEKKTGDVSKSLVIKSEEDEVTDETPVEVKKEEVVDKVKEEEIPESEIEEISLKELFSEIKSLRELIQPQEVDEEHPLDAVVSQLKADYDDAIGTDLSSEEKLRLLQDSFEQLGQTIRDTISQVPENTETADDGDVTDAAKLLSATMSPILEKLDLLLAQQQQRVVSQQGVPQRRGIDPALVKQQTSVVKSATPKLRAIIDKTT